jgi:hypothetical protein
MSMREFPRRRGVGQDRLCPLMEGLEERRLLSGELPRLIGITGNQQSDNPAYIDETLYEIFYGLPGTRDARFLDGFADIAGNAPDTILSVATAVGATQGYGALRVDVPQGTNAFWGFNSPNVVDLLKAGATSLSYDLTLRNIELNGGSFGDPPDDSFNGFAQNNELAVVINAPTGGFIQRNFTSGNAIDSMNTSATWSGIDGTRTITWDLTAFTSGGMSLQDFITANSATEARFWFVTQGDDTNGETGPMRFYFDNITVNGPGAAATVIGDFELVDIEPIVTLPFVPDTDAIGFNPESGLLHRTSGASSYRDNPDKIGYQDNHFMQTVDVLSPALTQRGVFNATPAGERTDKPLPVHDTGPYGLPAPRPTWVLPDHRRTDQETDSTIGDMQGPGEYHAARDLTWSMKDHAFYVADDAGIFKLTADGQSTFIGRPLGLAGGAKGITFFTIGGERLLLVSEREGSNLWAVDPQTGQPTGIIPLMDSNFNSVPGVLSLAEHPDGKTLLGIGRSMDDPEDAFIRDLIQIDPLTGLVTRLGKLSVHMADLAFAFVLGDTDFDGKVNAGDFFAIDRGNAMDLTGYENGDLNYSGGSPDAEDYMIIDRAFLKQHAVPLGALAAAPAPLATPTPFALAPAADSDQEDGLALFGDADLILA